MSDEQYAAASKRAKAPAKAAARPVVLLGTVKADHSILLPLCESAGLPRPIPEFRFHPKRKWRFDYAFPPEMIAVEIEGGVWTQGRHTRGSGFMGDMLKYNAAALLGWRVLRYTPDQLNDAVTDLLEMMKS